MAAAAVEDEQLLKRTHCLAGSQTEALKQILDHSAGTEDLFHTTKRRNEATATVPGCVVNKNKCLKINLTKRKKKKKL